MKSSQCYSASRPCPKGCCAEELKDPGCWAPAEVGARWWLSTSNLGEKACTWLLALAAWQVVVSLGVRCGYSKGRRGMQGMEGRGRGHRGGPFE